MLFRQIIDSIMGFPPSTILLVLVHGAALLWAIRYKDMRPAHILNVTIGAIILVYNARAISGAFGYDDWLFLFIGIAAINVICSGAALAGVRLPRAVVWITWIGFGLVCALMVLLLAFTFFIRFDKMI
jgi:hypothetical protein